MKKNAVACWVLLGALTGSYSCTEVDVEGSTASSTTTSSSATSAGGNTGGNGGDGNTSSASSSGNGGAGGGPCIPEDDHDPCTDDICNENSTLHEPKTEGAACILANGCIAGSTCQMGICTGGSAVVCGMEESCVSGMCVGPICNGIVGLPGIPNIDVGDQPSSVVMADVIGDGRVDLVVANTFDNAVSVLENLGNGRFAAPMNHPAGSTPIAIAAADFNGDGKLDIAAANQATGKISIIENLGGGAFAAPMVYPGRTNPSGIAVADLNADGKPDIAVSNSGDASVGVLINQANGAFASMTTYAVQGMPTSVEIADVNADNRTDLLVTSRYPLAGGNVSVFLNQGNGTFGAAIETDTGVGPAAVAVPDLDNDGKPDLAVGTADTDGWGSSVNVYKNMNNGQFVFVKNYVTFGVVTDISSADLDADQKIDIVATVGYDHASVFLNDGGGLFSPPIGYGADHGANALAIGDIDGNGLPDLAVANRWSDNVTVLRNEPATLLGRRYPVGNLPGSIAAGDFNKDGRTDVVIARGNQNIAALLFQEFDGNFGVPIELPTLDNPHVVISADFNEDGAPDFAVGSYGDTGVDVFLNNGNGTFAPRTNHAAGSGARSLAAADLDGNGHLDLIVGNQFSGDVHVVSNEGNGQFAAAIKIAISATMVPVAVAAADLSGDNKPDLVVVSSDGITRVLINRGDGTFYVPMEYSVGTDAMALVLADLNSDGKRDLAVANYSSFSVTVLFNTGYGAFGSAVDYPVGAQPLSIKASDLNGDGKSELIYTHHEGVGVLRNAGDGSFAPRVTYSSGLGPIDLAVSDMNGDGKLDLALVNSGSGDLSILLNTCIP